MHATIYAVTPLPGYASRATMPTKLLPTNKATPSRQGTAQNIPETVFSASSQI